MLWALKAAVFKRQSPAVTSQWLKDLSGSGFSLGSGLWDRVSGVQRDPASPLSKKEFVAGAEWKHMHSGAPGRPQAMFPGPGTV